MSAITARLRATPRMRAPERAELGLGALAVALLALIVGMLVFVLVQAWPSFAHNGLAWFGSGGNVNTQLGDIYHSPADPHHYQYHLRAWPLLYGTALSTGFAVLLGPAVRVAVRALHGRVRAARDRTR